MSVCECVCVCLCMGVCVCVFVVEFELVHQNKKVKNAPLFKGAIPARNFGVN